MRFQTLDAWLNWQQGLNPKAIELGLGRVGRVFERLDMGRIAQKVITVAGTNGKGSTVAYYETWLKNSGYRVASYSSPHLLKYNERIKLGLEPASDQAICQAFAAIDEARGDISLTYFEFGTLAAFYLIASYQPEVAILEVGLGGRLDAVNIIDADLAHITPIGLDHQDWLGDTVELIGREKAGILRAAGLAVCNSESPPASVLGELQRLHCHAAVLGRDYHYRRLEADRIEWSNGSIQLQLSPPLAGQHQALNVSGVLAGLWLLGLLDGRSESDIVAAFNGVACPGRLQKIETSLPMRVWLDVGHNEDAAQVLNQALADTAPRGRVVVLLGMLKDKNPAGFVERLSPLVDEWWLLGLEGERGQSGSQLAERLVGLSIATRIMESPQQALQLALSCMADQDILLVTGSFLTVGAMYSLLSVDSTTSPEPHS